MLADIYMICICPFAVFISQYYNINYVVDAILEMQLHELFLVGGINIFIDNEDITEGAKFVHY